MKKDVTDFRGLKVGQKVFYKKTGLIDFIVNHSPTRKNNYSIGTGSSKMLRWRGKEDGEYNWYTDDTPDKNFQNKINFAFLKS